MINLKAINLHKIIMKLKDPFVTSSQTIQEKEILLIEVIDENNLQGWGEVVAFSSPWYTEETIQTAEHIIEDFLIPLLFNQSFSHPSEVANLFSIYQRNSMAKAGIEGAIWDLYAKQNSLPLSKVIGGVRKKIDVGVAIGIQPSIEKLIDLIKIYVDEGYKRVKIKIKPGYDIQVIDRIRSLFPNLALMVDANSAYSMKDLPLLKELDPYQLLMIEEPFKPNQFIELMHLQKEIETPICLDESIHSFEDVRLAHVLGSGKIINVKIGRVGGLTEAIKIHDYCLNNGISIWCGGMLETGIGRAHNIALASMENFTIPGDISASSKYWDEDIITPEVSVQHGQIQISSGYGIGYEVNRRRLDKYLLYTKFFKKTDI